MSAAVLQAQGLGKRYGATVALDDAGLVLRKRLTVTGSTLRPRSVAFKAAIAVVQIVMFSFAFIGGLFLPPLFFAPWLDAVSQFTPSRHARELVIWAVQGGRLVWWVWVGILVWTAISLALALLLFRRDQGKRYR